MKNIKQLSEKSQNPTSLTKRERRKKFKIIKDTLHSACGKKTYSGIGDKKPLICDICKKRVFKLKTEIINTKLINHCENCEIERK